MSFSQDLIKFETKSTKRTLKIIRGTKIALFNAVVDDTPVGAIPDPGGRLRGNWQATEGFQAKGEIGERADSQVKAEIEANTKNDDLPSFLTNNLPYAGVVEYGGYPSPPKKGTYDPLKSKYVVLSKGGYSKQAPGGMVRRNVARFKRILREQARKVK